MRITSRLASVLSIALTATLLFCPVIMADTDVFAPLQVYLINKGHKPEQVKSWFANKNARFEAKAMSRMLSVSESKLNYAQFLNKKTITKAKAFCRAHSDQLRKMREATGVAPEVVVAILSVETRLGSYSGKWSTFNVLASQAVLDSDQAKKEMEAFWPKKKKKKLYTKKQKKRFSKRAAWARRELEHLIKLSAKEGKSIFDYRGSPAGAMGWGQFVPSSVMYYGADGDADGLINMHDAPDAIMSVGNYLKRTGWKKGLSYKKQMKVILKYNKSTPYAKTVLELSRRIS